MSWLSRLKFLTPSAFVSILTTAASASPAPGPGLDDLANASYRGLLDSTEAITLENGAWEGEPWIEGGATVPSASMVGELMRQADLDSDGTIESINLVSYSGGGTGRFVHLAVSRFAKGVVDNFATAPIGDRVMIRDLRVDNDVILVDLVQAGPQDGACCPGDAVTRAWRLRPGGLEELPPAGAAQRLSPSILAGTNWQLARWSHDEPVEENITVTLSWVEGRFVGHSACNRYFAGVNSGDGPAGSVVIEVVGSTRMACPSPQHAAAESRFLAALEAVNSMVFLAGDLVLYWGEGTDFGALYFRRPDHSGVAPTGH